MWKKIYIYIYYNSLVFILVYFSYVITGSRSLFNSNQMVGNYITLKKNLIIEYLCCKIENIFRGKRGNEIQSVKSHQ